MQRNSGRQTEGSSLFTIGWRPGGKCANRVSIFTWAFPKFIRYSVSIAEKFSNTLRAFPKESPITLQIQMVPKSLWGIPNVCEHRFWNFLYSRVLLFIKIKSRRYNRKFKKPSAVLCIYDLSNHTTYCQTNSNQYGSPFK